LIDGNLVKIVIIEKLKFIFLIM